SIGQLIIAGISHYIGIFPEWQWGLFESAT
ncbi:MAG: hypothetical protein QG667_1187, partial [Pseudomonadota bacterium]|nr:hypothetical protein [Pseudomonadota bacterium]